MRLVACAIAGMGIGAGAAVWSVRAGAMAAQTLIGPWATGRDFGSARADRHVRAVVALRGLLALPATEARYYNAAVDDAGRPLDGRCRYRVTGGALPAKWWSLTLYDRADYLVPNAAGIYSVNSAALAPAEAGKWEVRIGGDRGPGHWLPVGSDEPFELTLRAYLPADHGRGDFTAAQLPHIERLQCA